MNNKVLAVCVLVASGLLALTGFGLIFAIPGIGWALYLFTSDKKVTVDRALRDHDGPGGLVGAIEANIKNASARTEARAPPASAATVAVPAEAPRTKRCPFCGEEILAVAIKCKHCMERLDQR